MPPVKFLKRSQLTDRVPLSRTKIKQLIKSGEWQEGIHFIRYSSRLNLFNLDLITDWLVNKADRAAHQRAIDSFVANLPSNKAKNKTIQLLNKKTA